MQQFCTDFDRPRLHNRHLYHEREFSIGRDDFRAIVVRSWLPSLRSDYVRKAWSSMGYKHIGFYRACDGSSAHIILQVWCSYPEEESIRADDMSLYGPSNGSDFYCKRPAFSERAWPCQQGDPGHLEWTTTYEPGE